MASMAAPCSRGEREGECERSLRAVEKRLRVARPSHHARRGQGTPHQRSAMVGCSQCMAATLWPRVVPRDISPNTCGLMVWPASEMNLGCFQAELANGTNMKFVALMMLYNFHLGCKVIRALDH
jgi:hypothetical protein